MNTTSRRIFLYWVLLLLPTLAVGVGAFYFLRREQDRLAQRAGAVDESRRTALRTRARLAAENAELIVTDLQIGLLDTLAAQRGGDVDGFLDGLQRANPLVHATFRCTADGKLTRPAPASEDLADSAFRRRYAALLRAAAQEAYAPASLPLSAATMAGVRVPEAKSHKGAAKAVAAPSIALPEASLSKERASEMPSKNEGEVSYALNVQRARRDVQELSKVKEESGARAQLASAASRSAEKKGGGAKASKSSRGLSADELDLADKDAGKGADSSGLMAFDAPEPASAVVPSGRRGWIPMMADQRLCLLGWYQESEGGDVRGVELEMTALVSRLGVALPPDLAEGEGLCLRDERGRLFHQAGTLPELASGAPRPGVGDSPNGLLLRLPLNPALLPGWTLEAWLAPASEADHGGATAFFLTGGLLAGILVVALLSGGVLLMRQARASAREALVKTSFVANVSHELKTPLTTIRLYADLLEQGRVRDEERRADYLRTIGRESERLSRLVNNVLDFSRLERGTRQLDCTDLNLAAELAAVVATQAPRLAEAGLEVRIEEPGEGLPAVRADRDALGQVLLNLLDNAAKYAAEGQLVTVSLVLDPAAAALRVRVADRGPGVPAAERERIFEKFHRLDQGLTAEKGGAGLGLSIARQLARAMGGELRCLPREGGGAVFELSLPLSASKQK